MMRPRCCGACIECIMPILRSTFQPACEITRWNCCSQCRPPRSLSWSWGRQFPPLPRSTLCSWPRPYGSTPTSCCRRSTNAFNGDRDAGGCTGSTTAASGGPTTATTEISSLCGTGCSERSISARVERASASTVKLFARIICSSRFALRSIAPELLRHCLATLIHYKRRVGHGLEGTAMLVALLVPLGLSILLFAFVLTRAAMADRATPRPEAICSARSSASSTRWGSDRLRRRPPGSSSARCS